MNAVFAVIGFLFTFLLTTECGDPSRLRWCVVNDAERYKCEALKEEIYKLNQNFVRNSTQVQQLFCVQGIDVFDCMQKIEDDNADIINLDSGHGYFAGRYHNMVPLMAENQVNDEDAELKYHAVAVVRANENIDVYSLRSKKVCFPGIGMSAGWLYPISWMLEDNRISVSECNAIVKTVDDFFGDMCLPGSLGSFFNPFGNNPTSVCQLCQDKGAGGCTGSDYYAGWDGAFKCLSSGHGDISFLRDTTVEEILAFERQLSSAAYTPDDFQLLCQDGSKQPISEYANCNWGKVPANIIMSSGVRTDETLKSYTAFITQIVQWFGPNGAYTNRFQLFGSQGFYGTYGRMNLMFSESTVRLEALDTETTNYYSYVDDEFKQRLHQLNHCPKPVVRWCVISGHEMTKCENMIMAFKAKDLRPDLDCLLGGSTHDCMELIRIGDADLMTVDAGDVYLAGQRYGLVPIAAEDYGDSSMNYKVVAAARKTDKHTTLFNMKYKRACLPGIGRGDGWIVPLNIFIETEQFLPKDCSLFTNLGQLFTRSCIPGALDRNYNPTQYPISLCEGCAAGGFRKCQRNSEEQYYGAAGAFRCLVEKGGDVAFVRHLTVGDSTDGRNQAIWARNRRSDDYELMCKDGLRLGVKNWRTCYLGIVPANAIIARGSTTDLERIIFWNLLNFGQQFFSSNVEGDFHMFDSGNVYSDLLFTDAAVRLMKIAMENQTHNAYLGPNFIGQIQNLVKYTCVSPSSSSTAMYSVFLLLLSMVGFKVLS